ncbi:hypothetical protein [Candidatus Phytoplasma bonamiae]|uniref:Uncharacterized protein n=1 Tax=Candidatus Phytoplasma bonamiae TaxID=2982626 RepID=A0ABT9D406_9MOLU|nr:hypothetical protein ['Bonamia sp.' little leaf phytoplasma]MDO8064176.1 hypothetical protein ['Bonamia sp.' little leaf phytoplasma]MDV3174792.1 hypothetical protein ['Bonamia sp.' little leaf phytoplasma]
MASRMLGNLLVRFRGGLFVINNWFINSVIETQIIYPYYEYKLPIFFSSVLNQNDLKETLQLNLDLINTTKAAKIINLIQKSTLLYDLSNNIVKNKLLSS